MRNEIGDVHVNFTLTDYHKWRSMGYGYLNVTYKGIYFLFRNERPGQSHKLKKNLHYFKPIYKVALAMQMVL